MRWKVERKPPGGNFQEGVVYEGPGKRAGLA